MGCIPHHNGGTKFPTGMLSAGIEPVGPAQHHHVYYGPAMANLHRAPLRLFLTFRSSLIRY